MFLIILGLTPAKSFSQDTKLWYSQPAVQWTDALPIGNGRLGAMVYGGEHIDRIQFNESTLWTGRPREYQHNGAVRYLQSIRQLLAEGKQKEAEELAEQQFMGTKDPGEKEYPALRTAWLEKIKKDTAAAAPGYDDAGWKTIALPTPNGWEAAGLGRT